MNCQVQIYSYSRCSTCRKAISWLELNEISFEAFDIVKSPPTKDLLEKALKELPTRNSLFNTSGLSYRALGASVVKAMNDDEVVDALFADGKLIKRPFLITDKGEFLIGFKPEVWSDLLLN